MQVAIPGLSIQRHRTLRYAKKALKRIVPLSLAIVFAPKTLAFFVCCGLADVLRNRHRTLGTLDRYFAGNGVCTWLLSPFNLLMDALALPYWNRGIYKLADLPEPYQKEINTVIEAAQRSNIAQALEAKLAGQNRGMIFFKWYGRNIETSVDVPAFHQHYRYIRTIGVSIFNKKQSTGLHFGPLRITLRVLYNVNNVEDRHAYIKVGNHINYWAEKKLFIFDDTLQHQSCNDTDVVRCCMFIDILRPSLWPWLTSAILAGVRLVISRCRFAFYQHWTFIK